MNIANMMREPMLFSGSTPDHGKVVRVAASGAVDVHCSNGNLQCRRAASCLLEPTAGDTVALAWVNGNAWILAVLERSEGDGESRLRIDGDVHLDCGAQMRLSAGTRLLVEAPSADATIGDIAIQSEFVRLLSDVVECLSRRSVQVSQTSYRDIESVDHLRAGVVDHSATACMRLHAGTVVMTAKDLAKLDAAQIHLG